MLGLHLFGVLWLHVFRTLKTGIGGRNSFRNISEFGPDARKYAWVALGSLNE